MVGKVVIFKDLVPSNIQSNGGYEVKKEAHSGAEYIRITTGDDDTYETICQKLTSPIRFNQSYTLSGFLDEPATFTGGLKSNPQEQTHFLTPAILQILGGNSPNDTEPEI